MGQVKENMSEALNDAMLSAEATANLFDYVDATVDTESASFLKSLLISSRY